MSTKADIRAQIIADVLDSHQLDAADFFGPSRERDLAAARKDAAARLYRQGFSFSHIGRILKRDRTSIRNYLRDGCLLKQRQRERIKTALRSLPPKILDDVQVISMQRGISPAKLIAEWIADGAALEIARAREAA